MVDANGDETTTEVRPDGSVVTTHPDGTQEIVSGDGRTRTIIGADGSLTTVEVDGEDNSVTVTTPDGEKQTTFPGEPGPDGTLTTRLDDGTVIEVGKGGRQVGMSDPNGLITRTTLNEDGSKTIEFSDGTKTIISADGGTVTKIGADGTEDTRKDNVESSSPPTLDTPLGRPGQKNPPTIATFLADELFEIHPHITYISATAKGAHPQCVVVYEVMSRVPTP